MSERIRSREKFKLSLAVFLMMLDGDKVLLLLRSGTGWMDGQYSLPGGIMEEHETLDLAVVREVKEEVDCTIDIDKLKFIHLMHNFTTGEEWIGAFFATKKWQGEPKIQEPHKHSKLEWFHLNDLPDNINPYVHQAIKHYKSKKKRRHSLFGWEISPDSSEEDYILYYNNKKFKKP